MVRLKGKYRTIEVGGYKSYSGKEVKPYKRTVYEGIPTITVNDAISIVPGTATTKICCACNGRIIEDLYHIKIRDNHKKTKDNSIYSNGCIYIHTQCFDKFCSIVKEKLNENLDSIKQNAMEVTVKSI